MFVVCHQPENFLSFSLLGSGGGGGGGGVGGINFFFIVQLEFGEGGGGAQFL